MQVRTIKRLKKHEQDLINFIIKYDNSWQWYSNDRLTKRLVSRLEKRNFVKTRLEILDNGYKFRTVKLKGVNNAR